MKIMITGSRGQLGLELVHQLKRMTPENHVIQTDVHNLDVVDSKQVITGICDGKPDAIINCAAYTNVDGCEGDEMTAFKVNALGAQNLSAAAYKIGAKIIQISTDYVFEGNGCVPIREYDPVNPQSVYGKSKALGEKLVRHTNPKHFILRTAWLYGEGNNFVRIMLKLSREKKKIDVVGDQYGTPTSTVDLARCILNLIETENYGTYHATCEGSCSWYEFARKIFELKRIEIEVNKITTDQLSRPAKRPKYAVLENFMLKLLNLNTFRSWEDALEEYLKGENER